MAKRPVIALLAALAAAAGATAQQPRPPYLYVRLVSSKAAQASKPGEPARALNNERIPLQVCIKTRSVEDRFEQPDIQALNQHPEYFQHRPPPNVTLSLRKITPGGRQDVPFRIVSSGLGKDLTVYYVSADIDVLEDKAMRLQRAEQFVEWMASQDAGDPRSNLLKGSLGKQRLAALFEEQYINNPPGDYEIIARYNPTTPDNWRGTLVSAPLLLRVIAAGDFFEVAKAKLAPGAGNRP